MANNETMIPIPGRLHSVATEGHVAGADEIYDDTQGKLQSVINAEAEGAIENAAYLGDDDGSSVIPSFDPETDTLHKAAQVLTTAQKDQVAQNIFNKDATNGMGRIELKATDNFKTVVEAQTGGNTMFVIKYDFDLGGEEVTIPENCILEFDGGSINNGIINCNKGEVCNYTTLDNLYNIKPKERKIKAKIYHSVLQSENITMEKARQEVLSVAKLGLDGIAIQVYVESDGDSRALSVSYDIFDEVLRMAEFTGLEVSSFKFMKGGSSSTTITWLNNYIDLVKSFADRYKNSGVKYIVLFNENDTFYDTDEKLSLVLPFMNYLREDGYMVSQSLSGTMSISVANRQSTLGYDAIMVNEYPIIGFKHEDTTINDVIKAYDNLACFFNSVKYVYNIPGIISETGIGKYWCSFYSPSLWESIWKDKGYKTDKDDNVAILWIRGMFRSKIMEYVDEIWLWYNGWISAPIKDIISYYTGKIV